MHAIYDERGPSGTTRRVLGRHGNADDILGCLHGGFTGVRQDRSVFFLNVLELVRQAVDIVVRLLGYVDIVFVSTRASMTRICRI